MPRPERTELDRRLQQDKQTSHRKKERSRPGRSLPRHFDAVLGSLRSGVIARYGDAVYSESADIFAYAARTIARNWRRSAWRRRAGVRMWVDGLPILFDLKGVTR
jgi:hypothetical protein